MKKLIFIISIFIVAFFSCHKDETSLVEEITTTFTAKVYEEITGSIIGYVYDENNNPVEGATVAIYSATTKTNKLGTYILRNVKLDKQGTYLKVVKNGYILGSDRVYPTQATVYSYVRLFSDTKDQSFNANSGGTITISGGGSVTFPDNAIRYENGGEYNGKVLATTKFINPNSPTLRDEMPGDLFGLSAKGCNVLLYTAGMFLVQLSDEKGEKLNLKQGTKASFKLPSKLKNAPSFIPLWWFDENQGIWKEEGSAKLVNGNYEGEVSHFSYWNCDYPGNFVNFCGKVVDDKGNPIPNVIIHVFRDVKDSLPNYSGAHGMADKDGTFCGRVPKDVPLIFDFHSRTGCSNKIGSQKVAAISQDVSNFTFILNISASNKVVEGKVSCSGNAVNNSYILLQQNGFVTILDAPNGSFSFDWNNLLCTQEDIKIIGINGQSNSISAEQTIKYNQNTSNVILETCQSGCNLSATFTGTCQGDNSTITVTGGSGNYSYSWSNGSSTNSSVLSDSLNNFIQVTVTDVSNSCSQEFIKTYSNLPSYYILQSNCSAPSELFVQTSGNQTIKWSTGLTTAYIIANNPGTYTVTVCNSSGCCSSKSVKINSIEPSVEYDASSCNGYQYKLKGDFENVIVRTSNGANINYTPGEWLSIFQTGYEYGATAYLDGCSASNGITPPSYFGLTINNYNTQDSLNNSITGNKVNYILDNANCAGCTVGSAGIYNVNNLGTDLILLNQTGLPAGDYYLFVRDANTGCIIAHRKFRVK